MSDLLLNGIAYNIASNIVTFSTPE